MNEVSHAGVGSGSASAGMARAAHSGRQMALRQVRALLSRLGSLKRRVRPSASALPTGTTGIARDYKEVVLECVQRMHVDPASIKVEVMCTGEMPDRREVYVAIVTVTTWSQDSSMRLLHGLPLLQKRVHAAIQTTWLAEYGVLLGVWLAFSPRLGVPDHLRTLLKGSVLGSMEATVK